MVSLQISRHCVQFPELTGRLSVEAADLWQINPERPDSSEEHETHLKKNTLISWIKK